MAKRFSITVLSYARESGETINRTYEEFDLEADALNRIVDLVENEVAPYRNTDTLQVSWALDELTQSGWVNRQGDAIQT